MTSYIDGRQIRERPDYVEKGSKWLRKFRAIVFGWFIAFMRDKF